MAEQKDKVFFQPYEAGNCRQCGKYRDLLYLATLSSGTQEESAALCRKCAVKLQDLVDRHNAQLTPTPPAPQREKTRPIPPAQRPVQTRQNPPVQQAWHNPPVQQTRQNLPQKTDHSPLILAVAILLVLAIAGGIAGLVFLGGRSDASAGGLSPVSGRAVSEAALYGLSDRTDFLLPLR